jgi:hypothetical protein
MIDLVIQSVLLDAPTKLIELFAPLERILLGSHGE